MTAVPKGSLWQCIATFSVGALDKLEPRAWKTCYDVLPTETVVVIGNRSWVSTASDRTYWYAELCTQQGRTVFLESSSLTSGQRSSGTTLFKRLS